MDEWLRRRRGESVHGQTERGASLIRNGSSAAISKNWMGFDSHWISSLAGSLAILSHRPQVEQRILMVDVDDQALLSIPSKLSALKPIQMIEGTSSNWHQEMFKERCDYLDADLSSSSAWKA